MFGRKKKQRPTVSAIIVAAGAAERMEGIDKQLYMLGGVPIVAHSIRAFCDCARVAEIVVVCREENIADYYRMAQEFDLCKMKNVVVGGETRQQSVQAGLSHCAQDAAYIAIHDGARPLLRPEQLERCIDLAEEHGAAALGVPAKDTIKITDAEGAIVSTPERKRLYAIQTPQVFEAGAYRRAMAQAVHEGRDYSDDCQLFERAGKTVLIAPGSYENIKITTPEDIALAMAILEYREGGLEL